jgi:alpha-1,6-mannosyltransferase
MGWIATKLAPPKPMKVLDVSDFYSERGGGISCHLALKSHALVETGIDHRVVVPGSCDETRVLESAVVAGQEHTAQLIRLRGAAQPYDVSYHFLSRLGRVGAVLREESPDVVELNSPYLAALGVFAAGRRHGWVRTFFWHSNHIDTWARPALDRHLAKRLADRAVQPLWWLMRGVLDRCDAVITTTRWQTEVLQSRGVAHVHLIPFGVDKQTFNANRRSSPRRQELLGPDRQHAELLVAIGRLSAEKRFDVVLDAFLRYRQRHDAVLVVFGDGPEREALERRAAGCEDVRFVGFESNAERLATAFASADALLHGCPHETFGLAVAEALACGLPAVVPDAGGACENARGPSAEVYRSGSGEACAAALDRLMSRPTASLREAALQHADSVREQADHFRDVVALYEELCSNLRPPSRRLQKPSRYRGEAT